MRAAIVGAGLIAKQHLAALRAVGNPGVNVVAVCDLSPVMAESTADRFQVPRWYTDFEELLDRERPDVVHVTTPPASHFPLTRQALLANAHVFVEKPLSLDIDEVRDLIALASESGRWLLEDYNYRYNNDFQELLRLRDSGELGEVCHVEISISLDLFCHGSRFADRDASHPALTDPAGVVGDFLTHLCYLACAFVGEHRGVSCTWRSSAAAAAGSPTEFQALVDGELATAALSVSGTAQPDRFSIRVFGTKMSAETNLFDVGLVTSRLMAGPKPLASIRNSWRRAAQEHRNAWRSLSRKVSGGPGAYEGLFALIASTYRNLQSGGPPPISLDEIETVNYLMHDILQSVEPQCAY